ncbi:MAG: hypothetical protein JXJ20_12525 [Anaerolineae bacterium]|nr:hypothetical protein [Anaerolineae bacterium]
MVDRVEQFAREKYQGGTMMSEPSEYKYQYGRSTDLFVSREGSDHTLVVGGIGHGAQRWVQVLTRRAAQVMWFKLTVLLYPDKADMVTGMAVTAPLHMPDEETVTTHMDVFRSNEAEYTLVGWIDRTHWMVVLTELDARRLWAALDLVLYPVGWEGRDTRSSKVI